MEIYMKSNRKHIVRIAFPFVLFYGAMIGYMVYGQLSGAFSVLMEPGWFFSSILIFALLVLIILISKYKKGRSYLFTSSRIQIYDKGKFIDEIDISEVKSMHYYPFRWHYLLTIFFGSLMEGGAWKIHTREKDGTSHEIGFLSEKDAITLQEKLYPEILEIMYDKRKKRSK